MNKPPSFCKKFLNLIVPLVIATFLASAIVLQIISIEKGRAFRRKNDSRDGKVKINRNDTFNSSDYIKPKEKSNSSNIRIKTENYQATIGDRNIPTQNYTSQTDEASKAATGNPKVLANDTVRKVIAQIRKEKAKNAPETPKAQPDPAGAEIDPGEDLEILNFSSETFVAPMIFINTTEAVEEDRRIQRVLAGSRKIKADELPRYLVNETDAELVDDLADDPADDPPADGNDEPPVNQNGDPHDGSVDFEESQSLEFDPNSFEAVPPELILDDIEDPRRPNESDSELIQNRSRSSMGVALDAILDPESVNDTINVVEDRYDVRGRRRYHDETLHHDEEEEEEEEEEAGNLLAQLEGRGELENIEDDDYRMWNEEGGPVGGWDDVEEEEQEDEVKSRLPFRARIPSDDFIWEAGSDEDVQDNVVATGEYFGDDDDDDDDDDDAQYDEERYDQFQNNDGDVVTAVRKLEALLQKSAESMEKEDAKEESPASTETPSTPVPDSVIPERIHEIVWVTKFWNQTHFDFGDGRRPFLDLKCPWNNCVITKNWSRLPDASAAMFHYLDMQGRTAEWRKLSERRGDFNPLQKWIYFNLEPPTIVEKFFWDQELKSYLNTTPFFNWTMTYSLSSDVPAPAGPPWYLMEFDENFPMYPQKYDHKTKMVAWFAFHCKTDIHREKLVENLQLYLEVDIYGPCGTLSCKGSLDKQTDNCVSMLGHTYKFYLALENSYCDDYISEKFYRNLYHADVVPIVLGGGNYLRDAPPHSYINVDDFQNVEALASYLIYLNRNATAYAEYHAWRWDFNYVGNLLDPNLRLQSCCDQWLCTLCRSLVEREKEMKRRDEVVREWTSKRMCEKKDYRLF